MNTKSMKGLIYLFFISLSLGCAAEQKSIRKQIKDNQVLSHFKASVNSFDSQSDVILYRGRLLTAKSKVFSPWEDSFGKCNESDPQRNSIIIFNNDGSVHHIESCGELDAADMMIYAIPSAEVEALIPNIKVHAKESIKVPTEASVDTYLIWNGQKYVFTGPDETA